MNGIPAPRIIDALRFPRRIQPGCQHQLGCKCDPPMWLRDPSPSELARWYHFQEVRGAVK